jgi:hypothetical protein
MSSPQASQVFREDEYEVTLPIWFQQTQLPDGGAILISPSARETLRVRVTTAVEPIADPEGAARAVAKMLGDAMTTHAILRAEYQGPAFTIVGTGTSVPNLALLAYRVIATPEKILWALHELAVRGTPCDDSLASLEADVSLDRHRLGVLDSLRLR